MQNLCYFVIWKSFPDKVDNKKKFQMEHPFGCLDFLSVTKSLDFIHILFPMR